MAVLTRTNILSNERLDKPDFDNIELFVQNDFNALMKYFLSDSAKILSGFRIFQDSATLNDNPTASPVYIKLEGSTLVHSDGVGIPFMYVGASGLAPASINLVSSAVNYIEMDLSAVSSAADTRAFWDPSANAGAGAEFTQIIDTAVDLTAVFTVNQVGFTGGNKVPIAMITLTGATITANQDRRNMFFRLGTGQPNDPSNQYAWAQGQTEPSDNRVSDPDAYTGADKSIATFKEWMDAIMTEIKALKGSSYWFEAGSGSIIGLNSLINSIVVPNSSGAKVVWNGTNLSITDSNVSPSDADIVAKIRLFGKSQQINLTREDGTGGSSTIALADGEVLYVTLPSSGNQTYSGTGAGASNYHKVAYASFVQNDFNYWVAYREGSKCFFRGVGELEAGESSQIGDNVPANLLATIGIASEIDPPAYSSDIRGVAAQSIIAREGVLTDAVGDSQEDRSAYLRSTSQVSWSGTQLTFAANLILEIINTKSGTLTAHTILAAASPLALADGESAYISISRTTASETVSIVKSGVTPIPAQTQANKDIFVLFRRVGSYLHLPLHKQVIESGQTVTLGASGSGVELLDEGISLGTVQKLNIVGASITATIESPGQGKIEVTGGGGGGGGTDDTALLYELELSEADQFTSQSPNTILDDYDDAQKGTKTNTIASADALRLSGSNLTGDVEYIEPTSTKINTIHGVAVYDSQHIAPKNTAIVSDTIIVQGDVEGYLVTGSKILLADKTFNTNTQKTVHRFLLGTDDRPALLEIISAVYSSLSDETTIVVDNPDTLDLDLGIATIDLHDRLRIIPFDHSLQFKSRAASSYETVSMKDIHGSQNISIPGDSYFAKVFSITGSITNTQAAISDNGDWAIIRVLEETAGNSLWHFGYTPDLGKSWIDLGTKSALADSDPGYGFNAYNNAKQIVVSNDGKAFWYYQAVVGSIIGGKGVYADLASSPVLTDTPATGVATLNINGATAGWIFSHGSEHALATVDIDMIDGSFIGILANTSGSGSTAVYFTAGGSTFGPGYSANMPWSWTQPGACFVTGTSGSHRLTSIVDNPTDGYIRSYYITEGSVSLSSDSLVFGSNNYTLMAMNVDRATGVAYAMTHTGTNLGYVSGNINGTPSYSSFKTLGQTGVPETYGGTDTSNNVNLWKNLTRRVLIDPTNNDRVVFTMDLLHPDSRIRNNIFEVRSDSAFQGAHITQLTGGGDSLLRQSSSTQLSAQTFTATTSRFRSFMIAAKRVGIIAPGYYLRGAIYATSGGVPTGSAIYTSVNTYDPSRLGTDTARQRIYFNFDTPALSNGVVYAFVLESNIPVSSSNYININSVGGNTYASGVVYEFDGTTWNVVSNQDYYFEISGEWNYNITTNGVIDQADTAGTVFPFQEDVPTQESQLISIDNSNIQWITRSVPNRSNGSFIALNGEVYRSVMTAGSGGAASTFTTPTGMGVVGHERFLIFNVQNGNSDNSQRNRITGVRDLNKQSEDRSGYGTSVASYDGSVVAANYGSGLGFSNGYVDLNGGGDAVTYNHTLTQNITQGVPFYMEAEIYTDTVAVTGRAIFAKYHSGLAHGWSWLVNHTNSGDVAFIANDSSGTPIAHVRSTSGFISSATYYVLRVTYDGTTMKLWKASSPSGTFTEATYDVQTSLTTRTSSTSQLNIGASQTGGGLYFDGKIGYVKFVNGSGTPSYAGYKPQYITTNPQNLGPMGVFTELHDGTTENALNVSFNTPGLLSAEPNEASLVDSYKLQAFYEHTLSGLTDQYMYVKLNMGRATDTDQPAFDGINFKCSKT